VSADSFGFGDCQAGTESRLPCSEAAIGEDGYCRWHMKLARKMTRRVHSEPFAAPAPRKKVTK
jgi:hypothetical protein